MIASFTNDNLAWALIGIAFGMLLGLSLTLTYAMKQFRRLDRERAERCREAGPVMQRLYDLDGPTPFFTEPTQPFNPEDIPPGAEQPFGRRNDD